MINRAIKIFLCVLMILLLCGCSYYIEPENRIILTAIGLDEINGELVLSAESADVISNTNEDIYNSHFISVSAPSLNEALKLLENSSYGSIMFSKCPIVLIGQSLSKSNFNDFLNFCVKEHEIALSVKLLRCDNAKKILGSDNKNDTLIGYEILKLIEYGNPGDGEIPGDTVPEIYKKISGNEKIYMPYISFEDSGLKIGK